MLKMARNKEKRLTTLNRFLEIKQEESLKDKMKDEDATPTKQRPPLSTLHTVQDIRKWIPSLLQEIKHLVDQLEGTSSSRNYPEHKVTELTQRLDHLKQEHRRFVMKIQALDPSCTEIPWQPRGYSRKRSYDSQVTKSYKPPPIKSPLIEPTSPKINPPSLPGMTYSSSSDEDNQ